MYQGVERVESGDKLVKIEKMNRIDIKYYYVYPREIQEEYDKDLLDHEKNTLYLTFYGPCLIITKFIKI